MQEMEIFKNSFYTVINSNGFVPYTVSNMDMLLETNRFSRVSGQSTSSRYGTPANWTVENYKIPAGGDGTRNGLDRYPGYDCLTLGVWGDRQNNIEGDLKNARVYRKLSLGAGNYYFGATYEANYQLNEAYIFAANQTLETSDIPELSIAYDKIADAGINNNGSYRGIYFELPEEQEVILGFQADLAGGAAEQEFRASKVQLIRFGTPDAIRSIESGQVKTSHTQYDLNGRRIPFSHQKGISIIDGQKVLMK